MPEPDRTNPLPETPAVHGGGAMGDAICAKDWSATRIGPAGGWPAALRNALNLVLNSQESMFVMWGPDLTLFFNDADRPMLGPRLPTALGANISEVWADTRDQVLPVVEKALAGTGTRFEQVPLTMARYGEPEQTWWTFSFSPFYDDAGAIAGMLGVTREVTAEVRAAQGVRRAHNAEAVLAEMEKVPFRFDAVFSDVVMPGMGGIALARRLQALHSGLPVVLTSGYSHVLAQDDAHGFEFVRKPYSAEQISRVLRAATARSRPRRRTHRLGS